jgi:cholesterol oxidase
VAGVYDYVVIGSGFGGSVSAMRLVEKGYSVLVLEKGKRYRDEDFATTNWKFWRYLWMPSLRSHGIMQLTFFRNVGIMHGAGVGGGSLVYANVLEVPDDRLFDAPAWRELADWKTILRPHYETASRMLGAVPNPCESPSEAVLVAIATSMNVEESFRPTRVGVFFGEPGVEVPDPYFGGEGPSRKGCNQCGGCMVGCRNNAKNTLVKNYLHFAEAGGAQVLPEVEAIDVRPLPFNESDGARFEVVYRNSTAWLSGMDRSVRTRNVIFAAGVLGTLRLLFRCRDVTRSLPEISPRLGEFVRTNNEVFTGACSRQEDVSYSQGVAITSIFSPDESTCVEPVRFPAGSSLLRYLAGPLIGPGGHWSIRLLKVIWQTLRHPHDFLRLAVLPGWARKTTILLLMQTEDTSMKLRLGRGLLTLFRRGLLSEPNMENQVPSYIELAHRIARDYAARIGGIAVGSITEALAELPLTAHILGGCPLGRDEQTGVVGLDCQLFNYPGLYAVDSSIMPANPGVNPSLTVAALAEYAMSLIPPKGEVTA